MKTYSLKEESLHNTIMRLEAPLDTAQASFVLDQYPAFSFVDELLLNKIDNLMTNSGEAFFSTKISLEQLKSRKEIYSQLHENFVAKSFGDKEYNFTSIHAFNVLLDDAETYLSVSPEPKKSFLFKKDEYFTMEILTGEEKRKTRRETADVWAYVNIILSGDSETYEEYSRVLDSRYFSRGEAVLTKKKSSHLKIHTWDSQTLRYIIKLTGGSKDIRVSVFSDLMVNSRKIFINILDV